MVTKYTRVVAISFLGLTRKDWAQSIIPLRVSTLRLITPNETCFEFQGMALGQVFPRAGE
jgi:hypothetical protein